MKKIFLILVICSQFQLYPEEIIDYDKANQRQIEKLKNQVDTLAKLRQSEVGELKAQIKKLQLQNQEDLNQCEKEKIENQKKLNTCKLARAEQDKKLRAIQGQLLECQSKNNDLSKQNEALQKEKNELSRQYKLLQARKNELSQKYQLLQAAENDKNQQNDALKADKKRLSQQNEALQKDKDRLYRQNKALQNDKENLNRQYDALQKNNLALKAKIDLLKKRQKRLINMVRKLSAYAKKQKAKKEKIHDQYQDLKKEISSAIKPDEGQATIDKKNNQTRLVINLSEAVSFNSGSAVIKKRAKKLLDSIFKIVTKYPGYHIFIEGHTDNVPIHSARIEDNWELSTKRALSVLRYALRKNPHLDSKLFSASGYGEFHPIDVNTTSEGRKRNRRVDIIVLYK